MYSRILDRDSSGRDRESSGGVDRGDGGRSCGRSGDWSWSIYILDYGWADWDLRLVGQFNYGSRSMSGSSETW